MSDPIRHRCEQWAGDYRIHPDRAWLWGTCLQTYLSRTGPVWGLTDETSQAVSMWRDDACPFCLVKLETLL